MLSPCTDHVPGLPGRRHVPAGQRRTPGCAAQPPSRHHVAETVAEIFRGVVVDERIHARVAVHQAMPDNLQYLHHRSAIICNIYYKNRTVGTSKTIKR